MSGSRSSIESIAVRVARLLAIISAWSVVLAPAMGFFFSPIGAVEQPSSFELLDFACAFTIAGAAAAAVALALAGKRWWAVEIALALGLAIAMTAVLAYLALWAAPWTVRSRMDAWSFLRLQDDVRLCGQAGATFLAPAGLGVGAVVGAIVGGLMVIARRRPRLARGIAFGLFATGASEPVRPIVFDLVVFWGMVIRWLLATWPVAPEHVWAPAVILGAITGAFVASLALRAARRHRSGHSPRTGGRSGPDLPPVPTSEAGVSSTASDNRRGGTPAAHG